MLKRAESHLCEVNTLTIIACNFTMFLRFLKGVHFRKSITESERNDRFKPGKYLKIIDYASYAAISIAKYHCLYTQGAVAFQTPRVYFDSSGRTFLLRVYLTLAMLENNRSVAFEVTTYSRRGRKVPPMFSIFKIEPYFYRFLFSLHNKILE